MAKFDMRAVSATAIRRRHVLVTGSTGSKLLAGMLARYDDVETRVCPAFELAESLCVDERPDTILIDVGVGDEQSALDLVSQLHGAATQVPVVFAVWNSSEQLAIDALNAGVSRYLRQPLSEDALGDSLDALAPRRASRPRTDDAQTALDGGERLVGDSVAMRILRSSIARAARCASNVLITGETGTGKELVAELIHHNSARRQKPFVSLNSTAIPDTLLESELFGYERGAFTGAQQAHEGKLALGNTGTVFLDEIGDISLPVQAKLLRALDGKEIYRLGSNKRVPLDIRVVAATNQSLEQAIDASRFRRDLYYRLNVVRLDLPPLRDRLEDIPALVAHFLREFNRVFGTHVRALTPDALDGLLAHDWPGNIRELRNVLELTFVNLPSPQVELADLPGEIGRRAADRDGASTGERERLIRVLAATKWNKTKAADRLHWSRMTLYRKLTRYNVTPRGPGRSNSR